MVVQAGVLTVQLLGPVEVLDDGRPLELGGPQQRAVIAHLALEVGHVVSVDRLVDRLWGEDSPRAPLGTLQSYVSRLRRALEPDRAQGQASTVLVSEAPGYLLRLPPEQIDLQHFRSLVDRARRGPPRDALAALDEALALWRGPALAGIGPDESIGQLTVRLQEERHAAIEQRFDALLALGRAGEAVPALQEAVEEEPLRERRWALLALALYRTGRQAEALRALSAARATLLDELGLDPAPSCATWSNGSSPRTRGCSSPRLQPRPSPSNTRCRRRPPVRSWSGVTPSGGRWPRRSSAPGAVRRSWRWWRVSRASASRPCSAR